MKPAALVVALAVALAACTSAAEESAGPGAGQASSRVVDATPVGEPQNCVNLANIRESRVLSNQVIDFHLRDGRVMRNTLPHSCPQLGFERAFSYRSEEHTSELQSLMRTSYAVFCLKKKKKLTNN